MVQAAGANVSQPAPNGAAAVVAAKVKSAFTPDPEIVAINKIGKVLSSLQEPALTFVKDWLKRKL